MYYVCAYPQVYQRLQQEVDDCIRSNAATDIMGADIVSRFTKPNIWISDSDHSGCGTTLSQCGH